MITRKQLRLKGYNYRQENAYFITICCHQNRHLFGHITCKQIHLNAYGQFAHDQWLALADAYPHITLGEFVIMPNHIHGTIYVGEWDYGVGLDDDAAGANGGGTADAGGTADVGGGAGVTGIAGTRARGRGQAPPLRNNQ